MSFFTPSKNINSGEPVGQPDINYLAKDYASFRRLMLDRISTLIPEWKERNPGDLGITLVELLAYAGDYLSYQQDAVATEAYLGTARKRVSVRRHARLVDYFMHDGCNARVWVQVRVNDDVELAAGTKLMTRVPGMQVRIPGQDACDQALEAQPEVFETMHKASLYPAHNEMPFYTWGSNNCYLPKGATRATLQGSFPNLKKGDVLIFTEVQENADPAHRHAVRLTNVTTGTPDDNPIQITNIKWDEKDALPFSLCIAIPTKDSQGRECHKNVSIALGNVVLADHGLTIANEGLIPCTTPRRFRPNLKHRPLSQTATLVKTQIINNRRHQERMAFDPEAPAAAAFQWKMDDVLPAITLNAVNQDNEKWSARRDLLSSSKVTKEFVVEIDDDGTPFLRFGDGRYGTQPEPGSVFKATYRVGNGVRGNIGADTLAHIVSNDEAILAVRNPLPARGGVEPETIEQVRRNAPYAFRRQERAITPEDYAAAAARHDEVQRAAATLRWTGSWYTVFLTVDRLGGLEVDDTFKKELRQYLERYRMAGHDLEIDSPRYVSLQIEMQVVVQPDCFRTHVKAALLELFSNRTLEDNRLGVFHPDNFTFGQPVYLSPLYAAAQQVAGVASVQITRFGRMGVSGSEALDEGMLTLGRLEIARCDNDPNFPERGVFSLVLKGGK